MKERKSNRLTGYDYSSSGMYFITICVKNKDSLLGEIKNGMMVLNEIGKIAMNYWQDIPIHFPVSAIDEFIIMPDHAHGIIEIIDPVGNADLRSLRGRGYNDRTKMTIPKIIHGYKSSVTRTINSQYDMNFKWQKSYYDRIIRDQDELNRIRQYIRNNPVNWKSENDDKIYVDCERLA